MNFYDELFEKTTELSTGTYESCTFTDCDFSDKKFSTAKFIDCTFERCNLSNASINATAFQSVTFSECKLIGLLFEHSSDFGFSVSFSGCILDNSVFYKKHMKKTAFINC